MISFDPLWRTLKAKYMNKGDLQKLTGLSSATIAKLSKNESITLEGVDRIAVALKVPIYDVVEIIVSGGTLWEVLSADYFRRISLPDRAV